MDPISEFVQMAVLALVPPGQMIALTETTTGPVLVIDVRVKTRAVSGWLIGREGALVGLLKEVAQRALLGRQRFGHGARFVGVVIHVENEEAPFEDTTGGGHTP